MIHPIVDGPSKEELFTALESQNHTLIDYQIDDVTWTIVINIHGLTRDRHNQGGWRMHGTFDMNPHDRFRAVYNPETNSGMIELFLERDRQRHQPPWSDLNDACTFCGAVHDRERTVVDLQLPSG